MMDKNEIIERLGEIAKHAVHIIGEEPFIMSLDDGTAVYEAIDIIQQSQPQSHWIPCKERMPQKTGWYAVIDDSGGAKFVETTYYREEDGLNPFWEFVNPVAWMSIEIPEPYQEGE